MAFTTPKTGFIAGEGFAYTDINKTNENIRVLAGGDNTLPLSTDAATASALAKRDADGDIAFRDVVARDVEASRRFSGIYSNSTPGEVIHCHGLTAGENLLAGNPNSYDLPDSWGLLSSYRTLYSGILRVKFALVGYPGYTAYGRIYKNGVAYGTTRSWNEFSVKLFSEDLAFDDGDIIQAYGYCAPSGNLLLHSFAIYANIAPVVYGFY